MDVCGKGTIDPQFFPAKNYVLIAMPKKVLIVNFTDKGAIGKKGRPGPPVGSPGQNP